MSGRDGTRVPRSPVVFGFGAKLLATLLGTVGLVLLITLAVVRQQTSAQVSAATTRMIEQSRRAFLELEDAQRLEIAQLGRAFTSSPRTSAALEAAIESGDMHWLAETARYELALAMLPRSLAGFTDAAGNPVITLVDGATMSDDVAFLRPLVRRLRDEQLDELLGWRLVDGTLYVVQVQPLDFDGRLIGSVAFGLPVDDDDAARLGALLGAELCFVAAAHCHAGTASGDAELRTLLTTHADLPHSAVVRRADGRWLVVADSIAHAEPAARRVLALPLEPVLGPFSDIERALRTTGIGALLLALVLSVLLSRGLTRPVRALVAATVRVSGGDYSARVPVGRRDELGQLAVSFNTMTAGLLLKERYRGVLDKVVSPEIARDLMKGEIRLGGETREVTMLFADIAGFSALVDGMEPQRVIELLNECMARLEAVVQTHRGVVDKYIGDEIMALFGAPVAGIDDVRQAIAAALDMQDAMHELNRERAQRGELPVALAIGVHTGTVVAGNMGSPDRLNYTVLGDAVNLAKRLCSAAVPGQVLSSAATWSRIDDDAAFRARRLGARTLKGAASPIDLVAVERAPRSTSSLARLTATVALPLLLALGAAPAQAQEGGLPTLERLGLRYSSPSGTVQLALSGRLDLEGFAPGPDPAWLIPTTHPFVAGRARIFADLFVGRRVYGLLELRADRGHAPSDSDIQARVEQLFVRVRPTLRIPVTLQLGRFASPFGAYAARHQTDADPLIRPPLAYDHRTLAAPAIIPGGLDGFLEWKETARQRRANGAPVVWNVPYPWGALATLGAGRIGARFAVLGSAPSSAPESWQLSHDRLRHPTLTGGIAWRVIPDLTLGAAWSRGPWLESPRSGTLPDGAKLHDFTQETLAFNAAFARGRTALHGELLHNRWEIPNLGEDALDLSFYVEGSTHLATGLFVAARYGEIRFNRMGEGTQIPRAGERWDLDQRRLQLGGGYRIVHNVELRAEYLLSRTAGGMEPRDDLLSAQIWWAF